jgi:nitroimidazol reductase NimA-like FMN-containing flavoprotein (pyridoxamine 5'-phosphate oxidase superfamily)
MEAAARHGTDPNHDMVRVLTPDECWEHLGSGQIGRLAVAAGGEVDIFPLNYVVDDQSIVFRTAEGTKLVALVLTGRVAFEIDGYDSAAGAAWSVIIKGEATLLERFEQIYKAQDLPLFPWNTSARERFVRIQPAVVSGRRFLAGDRGVPWVSAE